jgi:hypothetical protein
LDGLVDLILDKKTMPWIFGHCFLKQDKGINDDKGVITLINDVN